MRVMTCSYCSMTTTGGHQPHCPYFVQTIQPFEMNALPTSDSQLASLQQLLLGKQERLTKLERFLSLAAGLLEEPGPKRHDPEDGRHHIGESEGGYCGFCVLQALAEEIGVKP